MRKATLMNQMRKAKQAGDKEEEARLRDQLAQYKRERKVQRSLRRKTYRVKEGDNYFSIAEDLYGDVRYAIRLAQANKGLYQLYQGMILQLPPKDEEEPMTTYIEMEGQGGTGGEPETEEMAEFNDAVTRYRRSQPVYTQPDDTTATAPQPAQARPPRPRGRDKRDGNAAVKTPAQAEIPDNEKGNGVLTSYNVGEDIESFMKNTWINTTGLSLKSGKPEDVQEWVDKHEDEVRMVLQEAIDKMVERGILQKAQQAVNENTSTAARYGDQVKLASLDWPGGLANPPTVGAGEEEDPTPEPEGAGENIPIEIWRHLSGEEVSEGSVENGPADSGNERVDYEAEYETLGDESKWQGDVFLPEVRMNENGGFGQGFEGWQDYYMVGEDGNIMPQRAAQYVAPGKVISKDDLDMLEKAITESPHYNLCGPLAVMAAFGLDLKEGMKIFANLTIIHFDRQNFYNNDEDIDFGVDLLNKREYSISYQTLITFIKKIGEDDNDWKVDSSRNGEENAILTFDEVEDELGSGSVLIAGVNINKKNEGQLQDMGIEGSKDATHWVWVQDVIKNDDGEYVRIFNPYMNREEIYTWESFNEAWTDTPGNDSNNLLVVAEPDISKDEEK